MQTMEQYNHRWAAVEDEESKNKNSKTQSDLKNLLRERLWRRGGRAVNRSGGPGSNLFQAFR